MVLRVLAMLLVLALLGGLNYFLYRRLIHDVTDSSRARRFGAAVIIALFAFVPLSRLLPPHPVTRWIALIVMAGWGFGIFTLVALAGVEVVRAAARLRLPQPRVRAELSPEVEGLGSIELAGVSIADGASASLDLAKPGSLLEAAGDVSRRRFVARATAAGALFFSGGLSTFGTWRAFAPPALSEFSLRLPGLPKALEGFTLVQISDLHLGPILQGHFVDELVSIINSTKPDLVAITGDLVDGAPETLRRYVARLQGLRSRHGTYFVSGNHDYYSGWERWQPELERLGFNVLRNRFVSIGDPGASFDLVGVDDWGTRFGKSDYDLDRATAGRDPARASVLLAHQPNGLELAAAKHIGLQLSGHTHGGQLFPGTLVGEVIWGDRNAGLCSHQGTLLYTNRGCGFVGPPMRVGAPPEVAKISLVAG